MTISVEDRLTKAYISLMQDKRTVAYSGILMVGKSVIDNNEPTARTNGRDIIYGRDYIESLTDAELRGLILHENKHKLYQHLFIWRKLFEEDAQLANQACDFVINLEIRDLDRSEQFIKLPTGGLVDEKYRGLDSGEVFKLLKQDKEDGEGGAGEPMDKHDWDGAEALDPTEKEALGKEIDSALRTGALLAGKQGGDVDRSFEAMMQSKVDWKEQLREFVSVVCAGKGDSTWARPNRRWLQQGMYLPSQISESIGSICIAVDTSGSISGSDIAKALSELVAICDTCTPERVDLLYWDTAVAAHEVYFEDGYDGIVTSTKPAGGGGTQVQCVSDYIAEKGLKSQCVVVITDGYCSGWGKAWKSPVLWVLVGNKYDSPTHGVVIRVD